MKGLCTICARGGSVGVKNKNIRSLYGKPLIAHSIIQAKKANLFDLVIVSSDSSKIRNIAKKWEANYVVKRPMELATDTSAKLPVIQHAVLETEDFFRKKFDFIVDLDATSPLRSVDDIIQSVNKLLNHPSASNLITACPSRKSPYFNMIEMDQNGFASLVKKSSGIYRRQDAPLCYDMNASIYVWKREALFDMKSVVSDKTILHVMPEERSMDIDTHLDWNFVKLLAAKNRKDLT